MSARDRLMWRLESDPTSKPVITLVFILDGPVDAERMARWHREAARALPRMGQRVVRGRGPLAAPRWQDDPSFDPARHISRFGAPGAGTRRQLLEAVEALAQPPLRTTRPPWEGCLIDGLDDGGTAYVLRISHAVADGLRLRDLMVGQPGGGTSTPPPQPEAGTSSDSSPARATTERPRTALRHRMRAAWDFIRAAARDLADPTPVPAGSGDGVLRNYRTFDLPLETVRAAASREGGKLQDALIAAVTEGCHRYHRQCGVERPAVRVLCPYGRPPAARRDPSAAGNHWYMVRFDVPNSPAAVPARIRAAREAAQRTYRQGAPDWLRLGAGAGLLLPTRWLSGAFRRFGACHDVIISNIPGSRDRIRLAGAPVRQIYGFAPTVGAPATATMVTYADTCHITLNIDPSAVRDPDGLTDCVRRGLEQLAADGSPAPDA